MVEQTYQRIETVLLAEDDDDIREAIELLLGTLNLKFISVANGLLASKVLASEKIDVLITDFRMPKMDGIQLLAWCRTRNMHLPVIFFSANADLIPIEKIALLDCCAFLMKKPINVEALVNALKAADQLIHDPNCVHHRATPV